MTKQFPHNQQQQMVEMYNKGNSASKIARTLGLYTTAVTRVLKRNGIKLRDTKSGSNHPMWKGGRGVKSGYWTVYNPTHPRALNIGRVWEHILVAEKKLGRPIKKDEPIHHIDLDRLNNKPSNLIVLKNNSEHQQLHSSLNKVVSQLIKNKTIKFRKGVYGL